MPSSLALGVAPPSPLQAAADSCLYTRCSDHYQPFTLRIITGNSHPSLAEDIAALVGYEMRRTEDSRLLIPKVFANGEIDVKYVTCLRGDDIYLVQPTCPSKSQGVNSALMELLIMLHTARLASAKRVTAVVPYMAYSRQNTMATEGTPIAATAIAKLLSAVHMDYLVTVDLNSSPIQGFFHNIPVINLPSTPLFRRHLQVRILKGDLPPVDQLVMVAVGHHNISRTKELGDKLGVWKYVTILTRRTPADEEFAKGVLHRPAKMLEVDGAEQCQGMVCITVDNIIDTFITASSAVRLLMEAGAQYVISCATHGLFTANAIEQMNSSDGLRECIVTDTTPQAEHAQQCSKLTVLAVSPLLSMAIRRIHGECADKEDDWDTMDWNNYDFDLTVCPISSSEQLPLAIPSENTWTVHSNVTP